MGIYGFENPQPLWTAKDIKIKTWLTEPRSIQGTARKSSSTNELRVQLEYSLLKPQKYQSISDIPQYPIPLEKKKRSFKNVKGTPN